MISFPLKQSNGKEGAALGWVQTTRSRARIRTRTRTSARVRTYRQQSEPHKRRARGSCGLCGLYWDS